MNAQNLARTAALLSAAGLLVAAAAMDDENHEPDLQAPAPELPRPSPRCRASIAAASGAGKALERLARAKIERYPFAPSEGLPALELLAQAENCFAPVDPGTAEHCNALAASFRGRLEREYREHLTRYEHARRSGNLESARPDIAFLLELLSTHTDPFTRELARQQRLLDAASMEP